MNEVYLRGKLVSAYEPAAPASQLKHLVFQLCVAHRNARQQVRFENYTVNAWRNLAVWASCNLQIGMDVFVRGHLCQRLSGNGLVTEVTALTITPVAGRSRSDKPAYNAQNATVQQSEALLGSEGVPQDTPKKESA